MARVKTMKRHNVHKRGRVGGDDIEMGMKEQTSQDMDAMERGRSPSPPLVHNIPMKKPLKMPPTNMNKMEEGLIKKPMPTYGGPDADLMVGGRKRRSKRAGMGEVVGKGLKVGDYVRVAFKGQNIKDPNTWTPGYQITQMKGDSAEVCPVSGPNMGRSCARDVNLMRIKKRGMMGTAYGYGSRGSNMTKGMLMGRGGKKTKKYYKGKSSKTRKGKKDFVTHKGDKYFHRKGHRQTKRQEKKGLFDQLFGL